MPEFKRVCEVNIINGYIFCSCKFRNRYGIDCPHVYHVISQAQNFDKPNHHDISVRWWNSFYQVACMSKNDKQYEPLQKAMKILQLQENEGLLVDTKWFNHLPISNQKVLPSDFVSYGYPQCINYPFLKVEPKELDDFENNPFTTCFSQDIKKFDGNDNVDQQKFFDNILQLQVDSKIGLTNKMSPYAMLIDAFKEMTSHLEGHCTIADINEIRSFFTNTIIESKRKAQHLLTTTSNLEKRSMISVTFPSSKIRKTHGTKHY